MILNLYNSKVKLGKLDKVPLATNIMRLLKAVKLLHNQNLVHGDIAAENVLVDYKHSHLLYLADFDLTSVIGIIPPNVTSRSLYIHPK